MTVLMDFRDRSIRLTKERQKHIANEDDPAEWKREIGEALKNPDEVHETLHHPELRLFYRIYAKFVDQDRQFYVMVKVRGFDMLVISAFYGNGFTWKDSDGKA
ncbi:hypothetical protein CEE37_03955 [candidate division LCP-89 bacterium B3_LCP]|uniref:Addiction module toxin RelE n=1 Tax=candidate division LCP-89 bacterium B3_LCP TaxID=2012998 RepID=A0A532V3D7_UNCL8|nr:MAG: hypothetical protein CEE37_03955 [candidate division LCP-89 bacterium B3_LCP]